MKDKKQIETVEDTQKFSPKKAAMLKALHDSLGLVTQAAQKVGINRRTHYLWTAEDPAYATAVYDLNNVTLDFVEACHFNQIREGNSSNIIFHLKCRGKDRGYIERQQIESTVKFESKEDEEFLKGASKEELSEIKKQVAGVDSSLKSLINEPTANQAAK